MLCNLWQVLATSLLLGRALVPVAGLGTSCSAPLAGGTAGPNDPYWRETIQHQGTSPFNPSASTYQVFRNVKDFGAVGDGLTDDTSAINAAISTGARCGGGQCQSSTVTPALIYFPAGTYLISAPIVTLYYTQIIGDARNVPTIRTTPNFQGIAVIDADRYLGGSLQDFVNQDNFFRSVRNFVIDLTLQPPSNSATGFHWQVSQATSLVNVVVNMSTAPGNNHQGIFMENGSGGFMGDIVFNGGKYGIWVGNQQFTVRNITVNNAQTAIFANWNWGWTFQGVTINNCSIGFDINTGSVGAEAIIDATVVNTPIFIRGSTASVGSLVGSLVLNNIHLSNVPTAVGVVGGAVVLAGSTGSTTIPSWGQGNTYTGTSGTGSFVQSSIEGAYKSAALLDSSGKIFSKGHPQYADYAVSQFISVKSNGAKGDGVTDDTAALQRLLNEYSGCKIIFFDAGVYVVTSTLTIPAGTKVVGEAWTVIAGKGSTFSNAQRPTPIVRAGDFGSSGDLEITDILFTTIGPAPGAVVVEWNVREQTQGGAGMWDSHFRLGGASGTQMEVDKCPTGSYNYADCTSSFLALHITPLSTAYLEGTWVWVADHDLDPVPGSNDTWGQLNIFNGRGILSQSLGPVWMVGTAAEHSALYQYNIVGAANHYMGLIQTETPYYQPAPPTPTPFTENLLYLDPPLIASAWGLNIALSKNIMVYGAGLYSFFQNYSTSCLQTVDCQNGIVNVDSLSSAHIYSLSTVGTAFQVMVNRKGIVNETLNANGFAQTVTLWSP